MRRPAPDPVVSGIRTRGAPQTSTDAGKADLSRLALFGAARSTRKQPVQFCLVLRYLSVTSRARRARTDGGLSLVSGHPASTRRQAGSQPLAPLWAWRRSCRRRSLAKQSRKTRRSTTYRRSQIYVTQRQQDHLIQGAKRGANAGRRPPMQSDHERQSMQVNGTSGHARRRPATVGLRLKSGRSAVRPRP